ncbi:coiled coil domain-containing protein [Marivita sp. S0852]|uniref:coiled coil domain-containing protein n=1 Tax=Marivita sp. S0852 TaxID=3373893 RepID=UPI003981AAD9
MESKDDFQKKYKAQLDEWEAQIKQLRVKAEKAGVEAQEKYSEQIEELKSLHAKARTRMNAMRDAQDDAWDDLKKGADAAWDDISAALEKARKRFA